MAKVTQQEYQNAKNYATSNYTADSLKNYTNAYNQYMSQGMSSNDAYNKASSLLVKKNTTNTSTPTSTQTTATQNSTNKNTTSTATSTNNNRNTGTYVDSDGYTSATQRNMATGGAEFGRSNTTTQKQTSTPATTTSSNLSNTKNMWDNLSYEQQQEKLNQIPGLKESLTKKGWTIKSNYENQGEGNYKYNPETGYYEKQAQPSNGLNYQDNSPERLQQIYDNLNRYRITNPELFDNWGTFSNFFINGLNRSPEQLEVLRNYYDSVKKYNGYDNLSPDTVGNLIAHGEVPDDYLNYLKVNDPQRYAEIMASKNEAEAGIMNESYYSTLLENSGEPDWMKWAKENQFLIDRNNDDLDDRLYHAMSPEEQSYRDEINSLQADNLKYNNAIRNLDSDLTEQYPDADLSTIMVLRSDRGSKIQKQIDANNVTLTKLQGTVNYMQAERQAQDKAGQQTINELKDTYGMFYEYTPEGMSQLAQARYAATNVTLDQADVGTDTQKQMALQSVLDGYYDKYGSIIQRSEAQVIGDTIAYAKNKGVSLSQALEDTFLKPLREKPQFATLSAGGELGYEPKIYKVGDNGYYFDENGNLVSIGGGTGIGEGYTGNGGAGYVQSFVNDLVSKGYKIAAEGGSGGSKIRSGGCGTVVNDYLGSIGDKISLTEANDIKRYATSKVPSIGGIAYFDGTQSRATSETKKHGHVGIVVSDNGDTITVLESNTGTGLRYNNYKKSDVTGYYNPSKTPSSGNAGNGGNYDPELEPFLKADPTKFSSTQWKALKNMGYTEKQFMQIRDGYLKNLASTPDDTTKKILDTIGALIAKYPGELALKSTILGTDYVNNTLGNYITDYDFVKQNLTMDNLTRLKSQGATFGSLTEGERPRIENSASKLNKNKMSESAFKNELLDIYNVYAEKSGMGTLTLDDIYNMYGGGKSSSGNTVTSSSSSSSSSSVSSGGKKITNLGR